MSHKASPENLGATVSSRNDFSRFVLALAEDFERNGSEWENATLDDFLKAMAAWIDVAPAYYRGLGSSINADEPRWRVFADILLAARVYE